MTQVILPLDLYDDLVSNTMDLLEVAIKNRDDKLEMLCRHDISRCDEIQKELSNDS